jgi:hypothetical protein
MCKMLRANAVIGNLPTQKISVCVLGGGSREREILRPKRLPYARPRRDKVRLSCGDESLKSNGTADRGHASFGFGFFIFLNDDRKT